MVSTLLAGLVLALAFYNIASSEVDVLLTTKRGKIMGFRLDPNPATSASYDGFLGIPYGQIPARFKRAEPRSSWTGTLVTQSDGPACPQPLTYFSSFSEDCLYLNVFTPKQASDNPGKLPVMAFIHGSAFTYTSSNSTVFGPDFLVSADVILVTMNYRLGAPGFLTLGSEVAPGNLGLFDTLLALQWIQEEISVFGGDPSQVTLFGQSAGSVMTQFHYLSSLSTDLFTKAIAQSGSAKAGWSLVSVAEGVRRSMLLAEALHCDTAQNDSVILDCLQKADIVDVVANQFIDLPAADVVNGNNFPFVPVLDSDLTSDMPFFNDTLANLMQAALARAKPMMSGFTTDEGISVFVSGQENWKMAEGNLLSFVPPTTLARVSGDQKVSLASNIRSEYFPDTVDENKVEGLVRLYTDTMFAYPAVQVTRYFANLTYGYLFAYDGAWPPAPGMFSKYRLRGVCHGDDLVYLFYRSLEPSQDLEVCPTNQANLDIMEQMVIWWTTFAKNGIPESAWPTISNGGYRVIDTVMSTMNVSSFEDQYYSFWAGIEGTQSSAETFTVATLFISVSALFVLHGRLL